jgi:hypothetical protein
MQSATNSGATWVTFPPSSSYEQHRRFGGIAYVRFSTVMMIVGVRVLANCCCGAPVLHHKINCESSIPLMTPTS